MRRLLYYIFFLLIFTSLVSCSAPKLYQQGVSKIERAIEKDPSIKLPVEITTVTTTVTEVDTIDNEIIKTITTTIEIVRDTCNFDCDQLKTVRQLRYEKRITKDSLRHTQKMYILETRRLQDSLNFQKKLNRQITKRLDDLTNAEVKIAKEETKQQKGNWFQRQMGKIWWLLLIIGLVAGLFIKSWIPKIPNPFKQRQDE